MARNRNTFEKMQREMQKKAKAAAKRERRKKAKEDGPAIDSADASTDETETADEANSHSPVE